MGMLDSHEHKHAFHDFDGVIEIRANKVPRYFSILFYGLVIWGVLFIAYFLFSGWSSEAEFATEMAAYQEKAAAFKGGDGGAAPAAGESEEEQAAEAAKIYAQNCSACHGAEGGGGIGTSLKDAKYKYGRELSAVVESIRDGRPGGMPGFGNQFSEAQIEALAKYVIEL